jgi:hypothetical protein
MVRSSAPQHGQATEPKSSPREMPKHTALILVLSSISVRRLAVVRRRNGVPRKRGAKDPRVGE